MFESPETCLEMVAGAYMDVAVNTFEPPKKGHFGSRSFVLCSEVAPISRRFLLNSTVLPLFTSIMLSSIYCLAIKIEFWRRNPW